MFDHVREGPVYPRMAHSFGRIGRIRDQAAERIAQDRLNILLAGHEIDHRDHPVLFYQKVAACVERAHTSQSSYLSNVLSLQLSVLFCLHRSHINSVPARKLRDIVKRRSIDPLFDPPEQMLTYRSVLKPFKHGLRSALEHVLRQYVHQLGRSCGIRIHIAAYVHAVRARLFHEPQRLGDLLLPVLPSHRLQMADMHGTMERPSDLDHLSDAFDHSAALLPHMHGKRNIAVLQRP